MHVKGDGSISRNLGVRSQSITRTLTTVSTSTIAFDLFSTGIQIFQGTIAGQIINLGNTQNYLTNGHYFIIVNKSTQSISIRNNAGTELKSLVAGASVMCVLEDQSTTTGVWDMVSFSAESFASPPFMMGRSGNSPAGTWLQNESVPTNIVGIPIFIDNGIISRIAVFNEGANTFTLEIYEHDTVTYTLLTIVTLTAQASKIVSGLSIAVTYGKGLAGYIASGSAKNIKVALSLRGNA